MLPRNNPSRPERYFGREGVSFDANDWENRAFFQTITMKVIIINGPMGVGKTTIGTYIADHLPGTALIDGDWCMDIHPFIGNSDTKAMAVDNILHLIGNYQKCTYCRMVVMVWLMDDPWVIKAIMDGLSALRAQVKSVTLVCDRDVLARRWNNDQTCKWRTDTW